MTFITRTEEAERLLALIDRGGDRVALRVNTLNALAAAKAEGAREAVAEIWQRFSADSPTLRDFSVWLASKHHAGLDEEVVR